MIFSIICAIYAIAGTTLLFAKIWKESEKGLEKIISVVLFYPFYHALFAALKYFILIRQGR